VGQKCESHLGVKQRTPAAGFGFGFGFTSRLSGVYQCVPVIMPSCEFPGQGKREILARFWDGIFLIRAINIPNNVLLLPFLPASYIVQVLNLKHGEKELPLYKPKNTNLGLKMN